ncbi:MAG: cytochrome c oxidase subunit II [Bacteroidota bacterium]|jgi:cytochrome c oxidase subunit 2
MFQGTSPFSDYVDATFLSIVGISLLVLLGILIAMVYFVIRFSRKRNPHPSNIEGNIPLEIAWTLIPLGLFMGMFYLGWEGYRQMSNIPEGALPIRVTARMWAFTFEYPNGVTTDTLYVPIHTPVKLTLHSLDVNHSMYIPAFRVKKDVIPNRQNTMWFKTSAVASYDIACAEYCGLQHAYMYTKVVSQDSAQFELWYKAVSLKQSKPYQSLLSSTR